MDFDIHQLEKLDPYGDEATDAAEGYADALTGQFRDSPEGEACLKVVPEIGYWTNRFVYLLFVYCRRSVANLMLEDVEEILTDVFPRKITPESPESANEIIPELIAFWEFLQREYDLPECERVLKYLHYLGPGYADIMNDPSRFGPTKAFVMAGREAGFDMTREEEMHKFALLYNAFLQSEPQSEYEFTRPQRVAPAHGRARQDKKAKRKMAQAARRKNRKKRK